MTKHVKTASPAPRKWTWEEYVRLLSSGLLSQGRVELVEGLIMERVPPLSLHFTSIRLVEDALRSTFGPGFDVRVQGPLRVGDRSELVPDVAVVAGSARDYRDEHPHTALLVVEVADTSLDYDRIQKASLYAKSRIPDYWIVNLVDLRVEVLRRPSERADAVFGYGYLESSIHLPGASIDPLAVRKSAVAVADLIP